MEKFVVFKEKDFEEKIKGWIERRTYVRSSDVLDILNDHLTEIDTDQNIVEKAEKLLESIRRADVTLKDIIISDLYKQCESLIKSIADQDIISKARELNLQKNNECKNSSHNGEVKWTGKCSVCGSKMMN